jgi:hypothetical protein
MAQSKNRRRALVPGFTKAVRARGRLAQAIGSFAMNFAILEKQVNHSIGVLLRIPTTSMVELLTAAIRNVSTRLDILQSLVNGCKMSKRLPSDLLSSITEIRELNSDRNGLLHGNWSGYSPLTKEWPKIWPKTNQKFTRAIKLISVKSVQSCDRRCVREFVRLSKRIKRYDEYREKLEASHEKRA